MAAPPLASLADGELHAPTLSAEEVDFFQQWGYLRLGPVAPPEHIEALRERIDDIMLGNVRYDDRMMMQLCPSASHLPQFEEFGATQSREFKGPTLSYRKIQDLDLDDVYRAYICSPLFEDVCRHLVGGGSPVPTSVVRSMFFSKPANGGVTIDWHQDVGEDALRSVTVWTALDPTTVANGSLQIVPGSHRRGRLPTRPWKDAPKNTISESIPVPLDWLDEPIQHVEMGIGEVVLLHNHLCHKSEPNATSKPRRALSVWYTQRRMPEDEGRCMVFPSYEPAVIKPKL